jgi:hypothetical protein
MIVCTVVAPWEAMSDVLERLLLSCTMSTAGPLGGDVGDPGASTINVKNVDGGLLGRRCRRSGSARHQRKKAKMAGPLGGGAGDLGVPTINTENINGVPLGCDARDTGAPTINAKNHRQRPP